MKDKKVSRIEAVLAGLNSARKTLAPITVRFDAANTEVGDIDSQIAELQRTREVAALRQDSVSSERTLALDTVRDHERAFAMVGVQFQSRMEKLFLAAGDEKPNAEALAALDVILKLGNTAYRQVFPLGTSAANATIELAAATEDLEHVLESSEFTSNLTASLERAQSLLAEAGSCLSAVDGTDGSEPTIEAAKTAAKDVRKLAQEIVVAVAVIKDIRGCVEEAQGLLTGPAGQGFSQLAQGLFGICRESIELVCNEGGDVALEKAAASLKDIRDLAAEITVANELALQIDKAVTSADTAAGNSQDEAFAGNLRGLAEKARGVLARVKACADSATMKEGSEVALEIQAALKPNDELPSEAKAAIAAAEADISAAQAIADLADTDTEVAADLRNKIGLVRSAITAYTDAKGADAYKSSFDSAVSQLKAAMPQPVGAVASEGK